MGKLRRVLKQVCLLHKEELDFLRGEKERLEAERDEWRGKALDADSANERLHAAMNSGSITINSQGVSAISNGETWTYKAFDLPESGTIQDILIEKNTGLEMANAILIAERDGLWEKILECEGKLYSSQETVSWLQDECDNRKEIIEQLIAARDAWRKAAEEKGAELIELRGESIRLKSLLDESGALMQDTFGVLGDLKSKAVAMDTELLGRSAEVCEIARLKERVKFLEAELKAEMDKADRLKAELEEVWADYVTAANYRDRVRAAVGQLAKVASSE